MTKEGYLNERGKIIFNTIYEHCKKMGIADDIDSLELSMLANSFAIYAEMVFDCERNGMTQKTKTGYSQIRAEYTIMKDVYQNILKHAPKFGLNPADRDKLMKVAKQEEEEDEFDI